MSINPLLIIFYVLVVFWFFPADAAVKMHRFGPAISNPSMLEIELATEKNCGFVDRVEITEFKIYQSRMGKVLKITADDRGQKAIGLRNCKRGSDSAFIHVGELKTGAPEHKRQVVVEDGKYLIFMNETYAGKLLVRGTSFHLDLAKGMRDQRLGLIIGGRIFRCGSRSKHCI